LFIVLQIFLGSLMAIFFITLALFLIIALGMGLVTFFSKNRLQGAVVV